MQSWRNRVFQASLLLFSLVVMTARPSEAKPRTDRLCSLMNAHTEVTRPPLVIQQRLWGRLDGNQLQACACVTQRSQVRIPRR